MSFLLDINSTARPYSPEGLTLGEVLSEGGKWFLLGIATVFAVLGLIWVAIELFHRFCSAIPAKKTEEDAPAASIPAPIAIHAPAAPVAPATDDAEIVAVIIAAIEAAKAETPNGKFRVVSFRKK